MGQNLVKGVRYQSYLHHCFPGSVDKLFILPMENEVTPISFTYTFTHRHITQRSHQGLSVTALFLQTSEFSSLKPGLPQVSSGFLLLSFPLDSSVQFSALPFTPSPAPPLTLLSAHYSGSVPSLPAGSKPSAPAGSVLSPGRTGWASPCWDSTCADLVVTCRVSSPFCSALTLFPCYFLLCLIL